MNHKHPVLITTLACGLSILTSCSGPESYQQKMARYTPKAVGKNQVPDIKTADIKFKTITPDQGKANRSPASAPETPNANEDGKDFNPTNKKLYFLSLYGQYESLKKFSQEFVGPEVSICPNFHTSLLRHNEKYSGTIGTTMPKNRIFSYDSTKFSDEFYVAGRPELLLPLAKDEVTPKVIDVIRSSKGPMNEFAINEMVHKALVIHLAKTYSEIRELCEYGVSDNYYIYENLITHIKNNKFEADSKNMNTLLKTTIFSNIALMTSLEAYAGTPAAGRSIASVNDNKKSNYATEVMARLNVHWASQYFDFIKASH